MLTVDLVRVSRRGELIVPRYVDADAPELLAEAEQLLKIFERHVGETVGALDEAIADHIGDSTGYAVQRGLVKLLMDGATVETEAPHPPVEVRAAVFRCAVQHWPVGPDGGGLTPRAEVLAEAARELELTVDEVEQALYADLKAEEVLREVKTFTARGLLDRYNLALAQAVLLRAREVTVTLPDVAAKRARQLFRMIKFHRLMYRARRGPDGYRVVLDGPLSLFRQTNRYGLQLALLLPSLCHAERWSLRAEVAWGEDRSAAIFEVDHEAELVTHTRDLGTWESDEERHFRKSWRALKAPWKLRRGARVIDLDGRGVLVPDYVLKHADGREVLLDIVWFWRARTFERQLELIGAAGPANLIVALATRYNTDEAPPALEHAKVYPFKGVIQPRKVIALAEEIAV